MPTAFCEELRELLAEVDWALYRPFCPSEVADRFQHMDGAVLRCAFVSIQVPSPGVEVHIAGEGLDQDDPLNTALRFGQVEGGVVCGAALAFHGQFCMHRRFRHGPRKLLEVRVVTGAPLQLGGRHADIDAAGGVVQRSSSAPPRSAAGADLPVARMRSRHGTGLACMWCGICLAILVPMSLPSPCHVPLAASELLPSRSRNTADEGPRSRAWLGAQFWSAQPRIWIAFVGGLAEKGRLGTPERTLWRRYLKHEGLRVPTPESLHERMLCTSPKVTFDKTTLSICAAVAPRSLSEYDDVARQ